MIFLAAGATLGLGVTAILLQVFFQSPLGYLPFFLAITAEIPFFFWFFRKPAKKRALGVTWAQVETLLRVHNGKVTPLQLANATGASFQQAKAFLNDAVVDGRLSISSSATELVYSRNEITG